MGATPDLEAFQLKGSLRRQSRFDDPETASVFLSRRNSEVRASQKSEVKKESPSCRMKGIEKHFQTGETRYGLYSTDCGEQRRPRAATEGDAIALRGLPPGGGWSRGARETV